MCKYWRLSSNLKYYKWIIWLSADEVSVKRGRRERENAEGNYKWGRFAVRDMYMQRLKVSMSFKKTQIYLMDILGWAPLGKVL